MGGNNFHHVSPSPFMIYTEWPDYDDPCMHNLTTQCVCLYEAPCMNLCMGGVWLAWPGGGDIGGWSACLLVEGTICLLAFYYIGYILNGQIMHSEIIII